MQDNTMRIGTCKLIFVDDTCFNVHTRRTRDRVPRGQPQYRQVCNRGSNLNLVMAINEDAGIVYYELERDAMTRLVMSPQLLF